METNFMQIVSDIDPTDLTDFFTIIDQFSEKTPQQWQQIAGRFGGRYESERLGNIFDSLCEYFGEPRNSTILSRRFLYELPLSLARVTSFPFLNLGFHPTQGSPPVEELDL